MSHIVGALARRLALGTQNFTSLGGKETEILREVEFYKFHLVWLTSMHGSISTGTGLLDWGLDYVSPE